MPSSSIRKHQKTLTSFAIFTRLRLVQMSEEIAVLDWGIRKNQCWDDGTRTETRYMNDGTVVVDHYVGNDNVKTDTMDSRGRYTQITRTFNEEGKLHCSDGPAVVETGAMERPIMHEWHVNGVAEREGGKPTTVMYHKNGMPSEILWHRKADCCIFRCYYDEEGKPQGDNAKKFESNPGRYLLNWTIEDLRLQNV